MSPLLGMFGVIGDRGYGGPVLALYWDHWAYLLCGRAGVSFTLARAAWIQPVASALPFLPDTYHQAAFSRFWVMSNSSDDDDDDL